MKKWQIICGAFTLFVVYILVNIYTHPVSTRATIQALTNVLVMAGMVYVIAGLVYYKTSKDTSSLLLKLLGIVMAIVFMLSYLEKANSFEAYFVDPLGLMWQNPSPVIMNIEICAILVVGIARGALLVLNITVDDIVGTNGSIVNNIVNNIVNESKRVVQENSPTLSQEQPFRKISTETDDTPVLSLEALLDNQLEQNPKEVYYRVIKYMVNHNQPELISDDGVKKTYRFFESSALLASITVKSKDPRYAKSTQNASGGTPLTKAERIKIS